MFQTTNQLQFWLKKTLCRMHSMHSCHFTICFRMSVSIRPATFACGHFLSTIQRVGFLQSPWRLRVCKRDFVCLHLHQLLGPELRVSWLQLTPYQLIPCLIMLCWKIPQNRWQIMMFPMFRLELQIILARLDRRRATGPSDRHRGHVGTP